MQDFLNGGRPRVGCGSPGNFDRGIFTSGLDVGGPSVLPGQRRRRVQRLGGRALPALPGQLAECCRGIAGNDGLDIMERSVGLTVRRHAVRVVPAMLGRIPARVGQVAPSREGDGVVDHDDLLVMRGSSRQLAVHLEAKARAPGPRQIEVWQPLSLQQEYHRVVPVEQIYVQVRRSIEAVVQALLEGRA